MAGETKMYGISNCDTIKKARNWMEKNGINYVFHDYKKSGITKDKLEEWVLQVGWEVLLNKRGTTFKKLPDMVKLNEVVPGSGISRLRLALVTVALCSLADLCAGPNSDQASAMRTALNASTMP